MVPITLIPGEYFHIYNRGNNRENIFIEDRNFDYFLGLYNRYIVPVADTFAYCLLRNHFHFLVRIKDNQNNKDCQSYVSLQFRNLFSTYTKAINKAYQRTGSLFEKPFKRRHVSNDRYFLTLIVYIHQNPQRHGFVDDYRDWPFSSYQAHLNESSSSIQLLDVVQLFGSREAYIALHHQFIRDDYIPDEFDFS
jgi:REP element-mobilizing transposase RayT